MSTSLCLTSDLIQYYVSGTTGLHIPFKLAHAVNLMHDSSSTLPLTGCTAIDFVTDVQQPPCSHLLRPPGQKTVAVILPLTVAQTSGPKLRIEDQISAHRTVAKATGQSPGPRIEAQTPGSKPRPQDRSPNLRTQECSPDLRTQECNPDLTNVAQTSGPNIVVQTSQT